ncbi:MAG: hypothetical protein IJW82_02125 [Clostridia bacterium]|nr:hypothetical protein [Clostridia bacterium]
MRDKFFPQTMSIRIPSFLVKLIPLEVSKRNFFKKNGQVNENEFFNKMLPEMLEYRDYKKTSLREYLDKNIKFSITEKMQESILDFLEESFDYLYFNEVEYECDGVINLRFDVKNEQMYARLFARLDNIGIKRSSYIRNLIHEYFKQSEYQKERICFNTEFVLLLNALEQNAIIQFCNENNIIEAFPISIEYSTKNEHWYLIYFKKDNFNVLYSIPIYKVKNILLRYGLSNKDINIEHGEKISEIIEKELFSNNDRFELKNNI